MNDLSEKSVFETLIEKAMKKFPKARRIAVENFSMSCDELDMGTMMNLEADAAAYKWNSNTVNAICWVVRNKHAFKTLADVAKN